VIKHKDFAPHNSSPQPSPKTRFLQLLDHRLTLILSQFTALGSKSASLGSSSNIVRTKVQHSFMERRIKSKNETATGEGVAQAGAFPLRLVLRFSCLLPMRRGSASPITLFAERFLPNQWLSCSGDGNRIRSCLVVLEIRASSIQQEVDSWSRRTPANCFGNLSFMH